MIYLDKVKLHELTEVNYNVLKYHEQLVEWIKIANEYKLPTFVMGVGLGGLIILNLLEKTELPIEGILLLSPMLEFKKNYKTRKICLYLILERAQKVHNLN